MRECKIVRRLESLFSKGSFLTLDWVFPCCSEKICRIFSYLTAFCIIRDCPSVCMCVSCCRFALFIGLLTFLHPSDRLQTCPEIREYLVQKLHRVK